MGWVCGWLRRKMSAHCGKGLSTWVLVWGNVMSLWSFPLPGMETSSSWPWSPYCVFHMLLGCLPFLGISWRRPGSWDWMTMGAPPISGRRSQGQWSAPDASSDHVPPKFMMQLHHILLLSSIGQYTLSPVHPFCHSKYVLIRAPKRVWTDKWAQAISSATSSCWGCGCLLPCLSFSLLCMVAMLWSSCSSKKNLHSWVQVVSQPGCTLLISSRCNQAGRILLTTPFEHPFLGQIALISLPAWQNHHTGEILPLPF